VPNFLVMFTTKQPSAAAGEHRPQHQIF